MKNKLITAVILVGATTIVQAATINIISNASPIGDSRLFLDASGVPLTSGYAAIGYFSVLTSADFPASTGLDLQNDFNILGSPNLNFVNDDFGAGLEVNGILAISASAQTGPGNPFIGKQAVLVVGNGSSLGTSTEAFIWMTATSIPEDPSTPITLDFSLSNIAGSLLLGADNANTDVLVGTNFAGSIDNAFQLAVLVPEPSTLLLSAFGALALLRRKR